MKERVRTGVVAKMLGVSPMSVRNWHKRGLLIPVTTTPGGHREYLLSDVEYLLSDVEAFGAGMRDQVAKLGMGDQVAKADLISQIEKCHNEMSRLLSLLNLLKGAK